MIFTGKFRFVLAGYSFLIFSIYACPIPRRIKQRNAEMCQQTERQHVRPSFHVEINSDTVKKATLLRDKVLILTTKSSYRGDRLQFFSIPQLDRYREQGIDFMIGKHKDAYVTIFGVVSYMKDVYVGFIDGARHFISKMKMVIEDGEIFFGVPEVKTYTLDILNHAQQMYVTPDGKIWLLAGSSVYNYSWNLNKVERVAACEFFAPKEMWYLEQPGLWVVSDYEKGQNVLNVYNGNWQKFYTIHPKYGGNFTGVTAVSPKLVCLTESGKESFYIHEIGDENREKEKELDLKCSCAEGVLFSKESQLLFVYTRYEIEGFKIGKPI